MTERINPRGAWWTAERQAELGRRLAAAETRPAIAVAMGATTQAIYSAVHRFFPEVACAYRWPQERIDALEALLKEGATRGEAAIRLGQPIGAVKHAVKLHLRHLMRGPGGVPLAGAEAMQAQIERLTRQVEQLTSLVGRLSARVEATAKPPEPSEVAVTTLRRAGRVVYRIGHGWSVDGKHTSESALLAMAERARRHISFGNGAASR